ncbi:MAG: ribosome-associated translation inhibitor RaiA [Ruminococcaceae bacterium]|nr:ribosome-associated translation inhibitor RaiA [Oscillospiraceae bacterium]
MKIRIIEKKYKATEKMKEKMEKKLSRFNNFFDDSAEAQVVLIKEKEREIVEITIYLKDTIFRVEQTTRDMYESFDECIENLKKQIRKYKTKLEKRFKGKKIEEIDWEPYDFQDEYSEEDFNIIKTKTISVKPMFVEEAILQMNLLNHQFYVFKNAESGLTDIVYKRKDGDYGLIETK